ncbi:hypothetical protein VULLAG_LOCUS7853 [Vulpes lagopus]
MRHSYTRVHTLDRLLYGQCPTVSPDTFTSLSHRGYTKTPDTWWTQPMNATHYMCTAQSGAPPAHSRTQPHKCIRQGHSHDQCAPDTDLEAVPRTDMHLPASEPRQEMEQRLLPGPTSSYTNILHGVRLTNRHSARAHNLTQPSPTQTHTTHRDTRQGHTDCRPVMPTQSDISWPHTLRPGESHEARQTAAGPSYPDTLSHPGSQTEQSYTPRHTPRVAALARPARAWARGQVLAAHRGWHAPRSPEPSPRPRDTPRPPAGPAELAGRPPRKGNLRAQHLPGLPAGGPCPATRHLRPQGRWGPLGRGSPGP